MPLSLRLSPQEEALFKHYAKANNMSLSELIRRAVIEKIEDEYDWAVYQEAYAEYVKSGCKSRPISELWKELDI